MTKIISDWTIKYIFDRKYYFCNINWVDKKIVYLKIENKYLLIEICESILEVTTVNMSNKDKIWSSNTYESKIHFDITVW